MGSDQSHHAGGGSMTTGDLSSFSSSLRGASNSRDSGGQILSPRQESVCSDSEVPYVSYTVNKPIGESSSRKFIGGKDSTLVVVNRPDSESGIQEDPELARLREIPAFLPIMRASLSSGGSGSIVKDPDILERLDNRGLMAICQRYENHLRTSASVVSTQQVLMLFWLFHLILLNVSKI